MPKSVYERCMAGLERECESNLAEVVALCPWMMEEDQGMMRRVLASHLGLVAWEMVDLGQMAGDLLALAERAEAVGDRRRAWWFGEWYHWACAAMRGEDYQEREMPEEVAALP